MQEDRIQIKGKKDGVNAKIHIDKFKNFDSMLESLISKLTVGKSFYKDATIK